MKTKLVLSIIFFMTLLPIQAIAQGMPILKIGVSADWPPMEFMEGDALKGYSPEYFTAVAREAGYQAQFINMSWDDLFIRLKNGEIDAVVSSVTMTSERRQEYEFSIPYYVVRQSLLVPTDSTLSNVRQIKGLKNGTIKNTTATPIVEKIVGSASVEYDKASESDLKKANSITFITIEEAVKAMQEGKLDSIICEEVVANNILSGAVNSGKKLKIASIVATPGAEELYGVAVKQGNLKVLIAINDGIKAVKDKGIEDELLRKWFPTAR